MNSYSFFSLQTGVFTGQVVSIPSRLAPPDAPEGCGVVQGRYGRGWRVDPLGGAPIYDPDMGRPADTDEVTWHKVADRWQPSLTVVGRRAALYQRILDQIKQTEGAADRAVRELVLATGSAPAAARMQAIEEAIAPLRARLAAINAAGSHAELDALGD